MPRRARPASRRSRLPRKAAWMALVSATTCASSSSGMAARCSGLEPPPSRNEPALATASMTRLGPIVQATPVNLAAQIIDRERIAAFALEQDRDGGERLEDVEQLFVGRVVGQEMPEVHVAEAGGRAGERGAPPARNADVLRAVF